MGMMRIGHGCMAFLVTLGVTVSQAWGASPAWLEGVAVDLDGPPPPETYLVNPSGGETAPEWFDLSRYPYPEGAFLPSVESLPGVEMVPVPGPKRRFAAWKVPVYAVVGVPRDAFDLAMGTGDKIPGFGFVFCILYQWSSADHLFRHPDDWYAGVQMTNKYDHGLTYGWFDGWINPGFFSNLRCTKWMKEDYSKVAKAETHNDKVLEQVHAENARIDGENKALKAKREEYVAARDRALKGGDYQEACLRSAVLAQRASTQAETVPGEPAWTTAIEQFSLLASLAKEDPRHDEWYKAQLYGIDKNLLNGLPAGFDEGRLRAQGLLVLAQFRGVYGNDPTEGLHVVNEVIESFEAKDMLREKLEVIRWVKLPLLYRIALKGPADADTSELFAGTNASAILALPDLAETDKEYAESLRMDFLNILQAWTRYEVASSSTTLERTLGYRILVKLKNHKIIGWRQQARELVAELSEESRHGFSRQSAMDALSGTLD